MKSLILKVLLCGVMGIAGLCTRLIFKGKKLGKPDNQIEELAERGIKEISGIDIDLSPDTPDKDVDKEELVKELWKSWDEPAN